MVYTIEELREKVAPIAEKHGVARVMLFGSYARGEATEESDVDFHIDGGRIRGLFSLSGFRLDLEDTLGAKVDVVTSGGVSAGFYGRIVGDEVEIYLDKETRNIDILKHIERYCYSVKQMRGRFGDDKWAFLEDTAYQLACTMAVLQIGELSTHLTDAFREAHPELPWAEMRGMRNFFAHEYEEVNMNIVWLTITEDIPALQAACEVILDGLHD